MADRSAVIEKIEQLRVARSGVIRFASNHSLAEVLQSPSPVLGEDLSSSVYVVKVLDTHPCLGKVNGRRTMAELGFQPFATVSDLSSEQRESLVASCRCTRG